MNTKRVVSWVCCLVLSIAMLSIGEIASSSAYTAAMFVICAMGFEKEESNNE